LKKFCFRFRNTFTFISETLRKTNRKKSHLFFRRGPCAPPSVEGQCFHLRRLDLQILRRCLAPVAGDRIAHTCKLVVSLSLLWRPILGEMSLRDLWHMTC